MDGYALRLDEHVVRRPWRFPFAETRFLSGCRLMPVKQLFIALYHAVSSLNSFGVGSRPPEVASQYRFKNRTKRQLPSSVSTLTSFSDLPRFPAGREISFCRRACAPDRAQRTTLAT